MAAKAKKKKSTARTKVVTKSGRDHFRSFMSTTVGHCVGVFNALVAGSSLEIFLGLTAAEIIIAAIVIWIIILRRRT